MPGRSLTTASLHIHLDPRRSSRPRPRAISLPRAHGRPRGRRSRGIGRRRKRSNLPRTPRLVSASSRQARWSAIGWPLRARQRANSRVQAMVGTSIPHTKAPQTIWSERGELKRSRRRRRSAGKGASAFSSSKSRWPCAPKRGLARQQPERRRVGPCTSEPSEGSFRVLAEVGGHWKRLLSVQTARQQVLLPRQCDVHGVYAASELFT